MVSKMVSAPHRAVPEAAGVVAAPSGAAKRQS
jgi:hypothetical protein